MSDINSLTQQDLKKLEMLREMQLPCHDDNKRFTDTAKLDKIHELLHSSSYMPVNGNTLYSLWGKVSLDQLTPEQRESMIVISTHVDMVSEITTPFVEFYKDGTMKGTFDNTATNAAIIYQMLYGSLPDNVFVAFTGNEEQGMGGARQLADDLSKFLDSEHTGMTPFYFTLDVTNIGFGEKTFSIENTFSLPEDYVTDLVRLAKETGQKGYLYPRALADESYEYTRVSYRSKTNNPDIYGCSLCVPTKGDMHSNKGCKMMMDAYLGYTDLVGYIVSNFHRDYEIEHEDDLPFEITDLGR